MSRHCIQVRKTGKNICVKKVRSFAQFLISLEISILAFIQVIHFITSLEGSISRLWRKHSCLQQSSRNSIEVEVDISIFLGYSVLYWHMEKHLCDSVVVASFNLHFFVTLFSMTLIVDCVHSFKAVMVHYV